MATAEAELQAPIRPGMEITEDELMRLPKDGPGNPTAAKYELVDGRLTEVPTEWDHDLISIRLILKLGPLAEGLGFMSSGQAGFRMEGGNVRAPDVSFTRKERIPGGKPAKGFGGTAPDLCIEIISPSEKQEDIKRKMRDYFNTGAQFVWHVFPEAQQVVVFTSPTEAQTFEVDDTLTAGDVLPGFSCRVADLFVRE